MAIFNTANYLAIIVAAIVSMIVGSLWYGPFFGKKWMSLMGMNPERMKDAKSKMGQMYLVAFTGSLVTAFVLGYFIDILQITEVSSAFDLTFWIWLGFVATVLLGQVLWEMKSWPLFFLNAAYQLVVLSLMSLVFVLWQ